LADTYVISAAYDVFPPGEAGPKAREAAGKALALDDTLAESHKALAVVKTFYDWDWPGAEREFKRAIELNPHDESAHSIYSNYLEATGRLDDAIAEAKRAQDADPLSLVASAFAGRALYNARQYDQAIEQLRKTLEMDPNYARAHWILGMTYEQLAKYQDAIGEFQKALSLSSGESSTLGALGHVYASSGRRAEAQKVLAELKDLLRHRYVPPFSVALVYVGLGDKSQALEWLDRASEDRSFFLAYVKVDPRFDSLRGEPRFKDLLRRMHLTP
jgi:tetratricopeptide (TPR) repeat protein